VVCLPGHNLVLCSLRMCSAQVVRVKPVDDLVGELFE
jgi:hypothetical protein